ncbi:MAG TPA: MauE/DoxX family redox-associated membrane protein [Actinomycetota bacterium]|nr:MauE/DoxX family redox-associated membrane protein [Actinomycetota bacterium]
MQGVISFGAVIVLAGTFAWAAAAKVIRFPQWRDALRALALPVPVEAVALWGVPAAEAAVVAAIAGGAAKVGAAGALALLAAFSLLLFSVRRTHGRRVPCGCFGRASTRDASIMFVRNAALALCATAVLAGPEDLDPGGRAGMPGAAEFWPAVLVAVGVIAAALVLWQVDAAARRRRR